MLYRELTHKIIGAAFNVMNELGEGFLESVYEKALVIRLEELGIQVIRQAKIEVYYHGKTVGIFAVDLLVEDKVIVELKVGDALHSKHQEQIINYLKASKMQVGLLILMKKDVFSRRFVNTVPPKLEDNHLSEPETIYLKGPE